MTVILKQEAGPTLGDRSENLRDGSQIWNVFRVSFNYVRLADFPTQA